MLLGISAKIIKTLSAIAPSPHLIPGLLLLRFYKASDAHPDAICADAEEEQSGTEYSNWVLARSARGRHQ